MWYIKKDNKFVSYLILLFSLFILFLLTLKQYENMQVNFDKKSELETEINEKRNTIKKYNDISEKIKIDDKILKKYLTNIHEDELIDYIYSYVENSNTDESVIEIQNLSISKGIKNELGFNQTNLDLSLIVSNEDTMKRILDFFASPSSKYNFIIDNFSYPNDWRTKSFNVNIPLKIFYK